MRDIEKKAFEAAFKAFEVVKASSDLLEEIRIKVINKEVIMKIVGRGSRSDIDFADKKRVSRQMFALILGNKYSYFIPLTDRKGCEIYYEDDNKKIIQGEILKPGKILKLENTGGMFIHSVVFTNYVEKEGYAPEIIRETTLLKINHKAALGSSKASTAHSKAASALFRGASPDGPTAPPAAPAASTEASVANPVSSKLQL